MIRKRPQDEEDNDGIRAVLWAVTWVRPFGQPAFIPDEQHSWVLGRFQGAQPLVFQVSAHPTNDADLQSLAVIVLIVSYKRTGGPIVSFAVKNVGESAVFSYRFFVTGVLF